MRERTAELRESEARYRSLTELASDWYWEQDENGKFSKVSGPVLEMLGIRVDALADGTAAPEADGWNEAERAQLQATIAARQPFLDFDVRPRQRGWLEAAVPRQRRADVQPVLPLHRLPRHRRRNERQVTERRIKTAADARTP